MNAGGALRFAIRDCFQNSWRLVPVNAALGAMLVAVGVTAYAVHAALVLVVLVGPVAAALVHCAVVVANTEHVTLADARDGLRLHWQRGLQLGAAGLAVLVLAAFALRFYARYSFGWPLVFFTLYLVLGLALYAAMVATVAIANPGQPLRQAARVAASVGAQRPAATLRLGLSLLLVNAAGLAAGVMPFLTLTVAYSFVAVAHFTLPKEN